MYLPAIQFSPVSAHERRKGGRRYEIGLWLKTNIAGSRAKL